MKRILSLAVTCLILAMTVGVAGPGWYRAFDNKLALVTDTADTTADQFSYKTGILPISSNGYDYAAVKVRAIIGPAPQTAHGFGLLDSCKIALRTAFAGLERGLDSVSQVALPCTLTTKWITVDSLVLKDVYLYWRIVDSTSDTVMTVSYPVHYEAIFKGN